VIEKDAAFFARAGIIDYSLLLGRIENSNSLDSSIDWLEDAILQDSTLAHGVFFTDGPQEKRQAFVIAIIDPLTGFTFKKTLEFRAKQCKYGTRMSCVPPPLYAERFKDFMLAHIQSNLNTNSSGN